jgi:hypothetical protein
LGIRVGAATVRRVSRRLRIRPAPRRSRATWQQFLRTQASAVVACGFFHVDLVYEQFRGEVRRLQKDPSPRVRAAALHVEQDACLIEELEANLDRAAEQGWRYSDADWVRAHHRRQATRYWLPL